MRAIQDLLDHSVEHERVPDDVAPALTIAAWTGMGLLAVTGLLVWLGHDAGGFASWPLVNWAFSGLSHPGLALGTVAVLLAAGTVTAIATKGFRRAAKGGQRALLGLMGAGAVAVVPVLWVTAVAAAILGAVVAAVALVFAVVIAMLDA